MNKLFVTLVLVLMLLASCSKDEPIYTDQPRVALIKKDTLTELSIYPNPFKSNLLVSFKLSQSGTVRYSFVDLMGRNLVSGDYMGVKYSNEIEFKLDTLAGGVYFLRLEAFDQSYIKKIVKQN
ncbi:MAG: T9SS type A sorting domain-containing protein [Bacteroidota bacterium]